MAVPDEVHVLGTISAAVEAMDVTPKDKQREAVVGFMKGSDVFVSFPTGYGKSMVPRGPWVCLCFAHLLQTLVTMNLDKDSKTWLDGMLLEETRIRERRLYLSFATDSNISLATVPAWWLEKFSLVPRLSEQH